MTNYNELSDFEINKRVAEMMGHKQFEGAVTKRKGQQWVRLVPYKNYDPCNNPADAWPIIVESKISVWSQGSNSDLWCAFYQNEESLKSVSAKPLRAAMIVFLMMNENENGSNSTVELVEN